jgi:hypothetical protein
MPSAAHVQSVRSKIELQLATQVEAKNKLDYEDSSKLPKQRLFHASSTVNHALTHAACMMSPSQVQAVQRSQFFDPTITLVVNVRLGGAESMSMV